MNPSRWRLIRIFIHAGALAPLLWLLLAALTQRLTFNPVQYLEQRSGDYALIMLLASLACTPIALLGGIQEMQLLRKPLGLYAAAYAVIHVSIFIWLDYGGNWRNILNTFINRSSLWFGLAALLLLVVLALTSIQSIRRRLKTWWLRIQKLVYLAASLVLIHYALTVKGNLMNLSGKVAGPVAAIAVLAILLFLRTKAFHSMRIYLRGKIQKS